MQKCERTQHRHQHLPRLFFRQRAALQKLSEILIGVFHHRIQIAEPANAASPHAEEANEMGVHDISQFIPARELRFRARPGDGNQLQRRIRGRKLYGFGEKNAAVIRASHIAAQRELAVDHLAFEPRPDFAHRRACFSAHRSQSSGLDVPLYNHRAAVSSLSPLTDGTPARRVAPFGKRSDHRAREEANAASAARARSPRLRAPREAGLLHPTRGDELAAHRVVP